MSRKEKNLGEKNEQKKDRRENRQSVRSWNDQRSKNDRRKSSWKCCKWFWDFGWGTGWGVSAVFKENESRRQTGWR